MLAKWTRTRRACIVWIEKKWRRYGIKPKPNSDEWILPAWLQPLSGDDTPADWWILIAYIVVWFLALEFGRP